MWKAALKKFENFTSIFLKAVFHKFYLVHSWIPWPTINDRECLQILANLEKHTILKSNRIQQLNSIATFWVRPLHHNQQQYKVQNMKIIWNAVFSIDFSGAMYFVLPRGVEIRKRYNWIFVTYFLFWYLMNSVYSPNYS